IVGNIERIGDHATNFADYTKFFISKGETLSERATGEVVEMKKSALEAMALLEGDRRDDAATMLTSVARAEQEIDDMTEEYRNAQMDRMKTTTCSPEASVVYAEMLTDFERIGDHLLNIAEEFSRMYPTKKIDA
ncbi:MAG: Na/Pi cotransporter family protein, partial [Oscillospiraceae bacterium]|nr:Na/Pi cotransporter family protein [Oscillospiraceae bacterium]